MKATAALLAIVVVVTPSAATAEGEATIAVHADRTLHRLSPYLVGACLEDVNHEVYGGIYSQLIFGESFQEPPPPVPLKGFTTLGGNWRAGRGDVAVDPGAGPKLIADGAVPDGAEVGVDVLFPNADAAGNAGLIVRVAEAAEGADRWTGYEVSLDATGAVVLGRHRQNWELLKTVKCPAPVNVWTRLAVRTSGRMLEIKVNGKTLLTHEDDAHPLPPGRVGLRTWQRAARFRNLEVKTGGSTQSYPFERTAPDDGSGGVSGMWRPFRSGTAAGSFSLEASATFVNNRSQRVAFKSGEGAVGVENRGLNRWGLHVEAGRPYEGYVWARADAATSFTVALESADGSAVHAEARLDVPAGGYVKLPFTLTPRAGERAGRFAVKLTRPGSVVLGHVFLQPGDWGRYKGLPVRKDVAEGLVAQGLTVLRYGGSMINHPAYRWKTMIGPRDRRPNVPGTWYPYSSNGWGILDFLDFCGAAGFLAIPALNVNETPQDFADFVEYVNGPADSPWGRRRVADGHPAPYKLTHVELGNEEAVDAEYARKFQALAEAAWAKDPDLVLVVGDFAYGKVITDPFHFEGGAAAASLAAHRTILRLARQHGREVWFDIHVWTDHPPEPHRLRAERSYIEHLEKLADGARFKVAIFEFNSGNHAVKRALSNACAVNEIQRIGGRVPVVCVANCLQPDGQNDNGWDQGLLFLNPSKVWLQPPGHLSRMLARHDQPLLVASETKSPGDHLDATATRSPDGRTLVLKVVNTGDRPQPATIAVEGFTPARALAAVETLSGPLDAANTADHPDRVAPVVSEWPHALTNGRTAYTFTPHSFTVLRLE